VKEPWPTVPLKALVSVTREVVDPRSLIQPVDHYSIPALEAAGVAAVEDPSTIQSAKLLLVGDEVLISRLNPRKARVAEVHQSDRIKLSSTEFIPLRPGPGIDRRFLRYLLLAESTRQHLDARVQSVTRSHQRVDPEVVTSLRLGVPAVEEQRRVADFLDDQVALLDRAIHLRQHNIGLVAERGAERVRTAVLGLDEPEPHKPVSTPWISSVPLSWSVESVGWRFEVLLGKMLAPDRVMGDYLRPYLRNTNVQWDRIDTDDLLHMDFPPHERARYELLPGDLLVCEGGDVGRAAVWDGRIAEIYYQKALHRLRPRTATGSRWMFYVLQAATSVGIFTLDTGTTIAHLTGEQLRAHRVPFPPMDTEAAIVRRLDSAGSEEVAVKAAMRRDIELLGERKQALITAAVTGEFDVSTASARSVA